jgi:hypothetical protein
METAIEAVRYERRNVTPAELLNRVEGAGTVRTRCGCF